MPLSTKCFIKICQYPPNLWQTRLFGYVRKEYVLGTDYTDFTVLRNQLIKNRVNLCNPCPKKHPVKNLLQCSRVYVLHPKLQLQISIIN